MSKFNLEMSKAIDIVFFIMLYFRGDDFFNYLRGRFSGINIEEAMHGFFNLKERHKSLVLPPETEPFVYTDYSLGLHSFLNITIRANLDFKEHTKDGIISFLQSREQRRLFWEHIFPNKKDGIAESIIAGDYTFDVPAVINKLNMPDNIRFRLIDMAHNFPKYQRKLVDTFKEVDPLIEEYYSEHQSVIDEIKNQISDDVLNRLRSVYKIPSGVTLPFYFSLLHGLLLDYRKQDKKVCIGVGQYFVDVLDSLHRYDHVSFNSFGRMTVVETRTEILDLFFKYKQLSVAEIMDSLKLARTTVYTHLNAMHMEGMIKHIKEKNVGVRVYYSINPEYFKIFAELAIDANKKAHDNISKGIEKYDLPQKKRKARDGLIYNDNDEYDEEEVD